MSEDDAFALIEGSFPRLDRLNLKANLAAPICAEVGGGQPPMLCATGPSGSGKGETIRLAASFLGEDAVKVQLSDDPEASCATSACCWPAGIASSSLMNLGKSPVLPRS